MSRAGDQISVTTIEKRSTRLRLVNRYVVLFKQKRIESAHIKKLTAPYISNN